MFYQEIELLLCVLKLYEKSYDPIANLTSAVTLKLKYIEVNSNWKTYFWIYFWLGEDLGWENAFSRDCHPLALFWYSAYSGHQLPPFLYCHGFDGSYLKHKPHTNLRRQVVPVVGAITTVARKNWRMKLTLHINETTVSCQGYQIERLFNQQL